MKLSEDRIIEMLAAAREAQTRAYAPYSKFHVGAAILTERGIVVPGCNVENASYGLTICAERNALARSVADDSGRPVACLVVGPNLEPLTPCGACRQVLLEFNPEMRIICVGRDGARRDFGARELLPGAFDGAALE